MLPHQELLWWVDRCLWEELGYLAPGVDALIEGENGNNSTR